MSTALHSFAHAPINTPVAVHLAGHSHITPGQSLFLKQGGAARSARLVHTQEVAGSNPAPATISERALRNNATLTGDWHPCAFSGFFPGGVSNEPDAPPLAGVLTPNRGPGQSLIQEAA